MYSSVRQSEKRAPYVVNLVADTDDDISSLPTHYAPGSTCFVIDTSTTYMLNGSKEWIAIESSSSSSGSGETVDASLASESDIDALFE